MENRTAKVSVVGEQVLPAFMIVFRALTLLEGAGKCLASVIPLTMASRKNKPVNQKPNACIWDSIKQKQFITIYYEQRGTLSNSMYRATIAEYDDIRLK